MPDLHIITNFNCTILQYQNKYPMKYYTNLKARTIVIISYLYIFLFTYAAVSKLIDYRDFSIKLGQSPLLSAFAGYVAVGIPVTELIIVVMLFLPKWRTLGLYAAYGLMIAFTMYIFLILNYSDYVPCSCGGILEKMGWQEHLIFNIVFTALALTAILLSQNSAKSRIRKIWFGLTLTAVTLACMLSVLFLFLWSESIIHTRNNFIRRFPTHARPEDKKLDVNFKTWYFAGDADGKIYLGNTKAALLVSVIDTALTTKREAEIKIHQQDIPFLSAQVGVVPPYFYLFDGTVPCIFKGETTDWKATLQPDNPERSTIGLPTEGGNFIFRHTSLKKRSNVLAAFGPDTETKSRFLLEKQTDGIFDTDGMMLYNRQRKEVQYVYYYRNEYLVFDPSLKLKYKRHTIDTVSIAKIKTVYNEAGEGTMAAPPLVINRNAASYGNLLFIQSNRIGKYEDSEILKYATIVDIYHTPTGNYVSSLYVYHIGKEKMRSFRIIGNTLYTLTGNYLTALKLDQKITALY